MADDRYTKPRIADDYTAIAARMKELRLGTISQGFELSLPQGVSILVASDVRPPITLPLDSHLVLIFHPSAHPTSTAKIIVYHFDRQDRALRCMEELLNSLRRLYPKVKHISGEIHLPYDDGIDLLFRLRKR
jgi:hypothetical protein